MASGFQELGTRTLALQGLVQLEHGIQQPRHGRELDDVLQTNLRRLFEEPRGRLPTSTLEHSTRRAPRIRRLASSSRPRLVIAAQEAKEEEDSNGMAVDLGVFASCRRRPGPPWPSRSAACSAPTPPAVPAPCGNVLGASGSLHVELVGLLV